MECNLTLSDFNNIISRMRVCKKISNINVLDVRSNGKGKQHRVEFDYNNITHLFCLDFQWTPYVYVELGYAGCLVDNPIERLNKILN